MIVLANEDILTASLTALDAFGMGAVESQLMGVKCYASSNVPKDVDIGGCEFLDLKLGAKEWARQIINNEGFHLQEEKKLLFEK